ncbi:MAG: S-layer homology domain-containing protein [Bacillota bacterium]
MQVLPRRHRVWLALLQVALLLVTFAMPAAAATTSPSLSGQQWLTLLRTYNIVRGDNTGQLNLDQPITRAQMVAIMVRALGAEEDAKFFRGLTTFTDVKGHWAEAEIAYAEAYKLVKGDGNGTFRPDAQISYGEALTLILRMVGEEPTTGVWPFNVLARAGELGLAPVGVTAANINVDAIRGLVFQSMATAIHDIRDEDGLNFLQKYVDNKGPELTVTLPQGEPGATLKVSGTTKDAAGVSVNGKEVSLLRGAFSADVSLDYGENTIEVKAWDLAGNVETYTATVTRSFPVAVLGITGPEKVAPNSTQTYEITAVDDKDQPVSLDLINVTVEGGIGTFNKATGTLTVTGNPGAKGKIVVSAGTLSKSVSVTVMGPSAAANRLSIGSLQTVAYTKPMTVTVQVLDALGNVVTEDYGRPIALASAGLEGVTVTPAVATTTAGVATFTVKATKMGQVSLTATSAGLTSSTVSGTFGSTRRIRLTADPATLVAGSLNTLARIKAELLDENGQVVTNDTGEIIGITIKTQSDAGSLTDTNLSIAKGMSNSTQSGNDGMFSLFGMLGGTATITGEVTTGPNLTVDPVTVTVTVPQVGPGTKLSAVASSAVLNAPGTATFVVRLIDAAGNYIPTGEYAFQVRIDTSNNESKVAGLPSDGSLTVSLGDTGLNPVDDGVAEGAVNDGADVVARTAGGSAIIKVTYSKSGKVTLTPVPAAATATAYNAYGALGNGASSLGLIAEPASASFQKSVAGVSLRADSNLGTGQPVAAVANNQASATTVHVTLVDNVGAWVPGQIRNVTLERLPDSGTDVVNTTPPAVLSTTTNDGKASFVIRGSTTAGVDTYRVTADLGGSTVSSTIEVYVDSAKPATPSIASVRGYKGSIPGSLNEVGPEDDGLEIVLLPGSTKWAQARVYVEGGYSPIHVTEAIDFSSSEARILVPKSKLPAGSKRYQVSLVNGFSESDRSGYSATVLNATYNPYITIYSAQYDAASNKLYISGSGFSYNPSYPDSVNTGKLTLKDLSTNQTVSLLGADVQITSSASIILTLTSSQAAAFETPSLFAGTDLRILAEGGWYARYNGEMAASDLNDNAVTPGARIRYVVLDRPNKQLYVYGEGFTTGEPQWSAFSLTYTGAPAEDTFVLSTMSPVRRSDTELVFTLTDTVISRLDAVSGYVLQVTGDGWFRNGSGASPAAGTFSIFTKLKLLSVTYDDATDEVTITGSGFNFTTGQVFPANMTIVDLGTGQNLSLSGASVTSVTATTIVIKLTSGQASTFENTTNFNGSDIYLRATDGWAQDAQNRQAAAIGDYDLRFPSR